MAAITGLITVNNKLILEVDADPSAGGGTVAGRGSLAMFDTGAIGQLYLKTGAADTAWSLIDNTAADWLLAGNALTGAEKFGSTNDFDVPFIRNNIEAMRIVGTTAALQGILIGLNASLGGRLQLQPTNQGDDILKQIHGATNQIINVTRMYRKTTVSNAVSTFTIAVPNDYNALIETKVIGIQTGGATGAVGDGASYIRTLHVQNIGGAVAIMQTQTDFTYEIVAGFNFTSLASGADVEYSIQGVLNRNVSWGIKTELTLATT